MSTGSVVRKNLNDLSKPIELRELNRQLDWMWKKILGGLTAKDFSDAGIKSVITTVEKTVAEEILTDKLETNVLVAALAEMMVAKIGVAKIDYAQIVDMFANSIFTDTGIAGKFRIDGLEVMQAQIVDLVVSSFRLVSQDGKVYKVSVDAEGNLHTEYLEDQEDWMQGGKVPDGYSAVASKLTVGDVTSGNLYVSGAADIMKLTAKVLTADQGFINDLTSSNIFANYLMANEAFLDLLRTSKIVSGKSLELIAGETEELERLSNIEVVEGTFAQIDRREGEGIRIYSEIWPKQDLSKGAPYPLGGGRNLCPFDEFTTNTSGGNTTADAKAPALTAGQSVMLYGETTDGVVLNGSNAQFIFKDDSGATVWAISPRVKGTAAIVPDNYGQATKMHFYTNSSLAGKTVRLMIEVGSATEWSPSTNICPIEGCACLNATRRGRNLLPPGMPMEKTVNGITFTSYGEGTYKIDGTSTSTASLKVYLTAPVTFRDMIPYIHLFNSVASSNCSFAYFRPDGSQITWTTTTPANRIQYQTSLVNETISAINLYVGANTTINNLVMTPMLCFDGDVIPFEPYQGTDYMLDFGKNLIPSMNVESYERNGIKFVQNTDGSITINGTATGYTSANSDFVDAVPLRGKTLTIKGGGASNPVVTQVYIQCTSGNVYKSCTGSNMDALTFVMPDDANTVRFEVYVGNGQAPSNIVVYPQLELGSTSTSYAPYNTEMLEQTNGVVYGGTVDWHAGEMTVEWVKIELDGTQSIASSPGDKNLTDRFVVSGLPKFVQNAGYSDRYKMQSWATDDYAYYPYNGNIYIRHKGIDGVDAYNAYAAAQKTAGTPVQFVCKLAEPRTIPLTPVQIETLQGINTVYTDADGGRVEFGHDLVEVIDNVMPPASPKTGTLWLDRSLTPAVLRRWSGTEWEIVNDVSLIESVQDAILLKQAKLEEEQRKTALYLKLDDTMKAVRIGQNGVTSEFRIDAFGSGVVVNDEIFSRFEASRVLFGNMEIRRPNVGGLAFDSIK